MQSNDFDIFIEKVPCVKERFLGVFALDKIPKQMACKTALIFNTDFSHEKGSHWCSLVRSFGNDYEIFDSLGSHFNKVKTNLKFKNAIYFSNGDAYQLPYSDTCGLFAITFVIERLMNIDIPFDDFLNDIFVTNKEKNENFVKEFCLSL